MSRILTRFAAGAALIGSMAGAMSAATTEYLVVDRNSGLAISGFDPMAYFINGAPSLGKGEYELRHAGAVWRFRNEGNRAAFAADPEIYAPRFGGYDPVGIAGGVGIPGDPRLWIVAGERLYLFNSPGNKTAFLNDTGRVIAAADKQWPSVQLTLSP